MFNKLLIIIDSNKITIIILFSNSIIKCCMTVTRPLNVATCCWTVYPYQCPGGSPQAYIRALLVPPGSRTYFYVFPPPGFFIYRVSGLLFVRQFAGFEALNSFLFSRAILLIQKLDSCHVFHRLEKVYCLFSILAPTD